MLLVVIRGQVVERETGSERGVVYNGYDAPSFGFILAHISLTESFFIDAVEDGENTRGGRGVNKGEKIGNKP